MGAYLHSINDAMNIAELKAGIDGWKAYHWTAATGGSLIEGCVPDGVYLRGPRKGLPRFSRPKEGTKKMVVITELEMDLAAREYEAATGSCYECKGTQKVICGWNRETGHRYEPCARCESTGKAPT